MYLVYVTSKCIFIVFVRTHPNLGVPVSHGQGSSSCRGRLPISRPLIFAEAFRPPETGLVLACFRFVRVTSKGDERGSLTKDYYSHVRSGGKGPGGGRLPPEILEIFN